MSLRRTAAVLALLPLLVTACSEDDPEPAPPAPTSTPTAEPSPTEPPSERALEPWQKNTRAGAVAFTKYWHQILSEAQANGDPADLRDISADECESCEGVAGLLEMWYSAGGFYRNEGWKVVRAVPGPQEGVPKNEVQMFVRVLRTAEQIKERTDGPLITNPASTAEFTARVAWQAGRWQMLVIDRLT